MFQDSLMESKENGDLYDVVFLDGQHEEAATNYYTELILPVLNEGGGIIYDDIYWSEGMKNAWDLIRRSEEFSITFDLGNRGLAIKKSSRDKSNKKYNFSISSLLGAPSIYRPGW